MLLKCSLILLILMQLWTPGSADILGPNSLYRYTGYEGFCNATWYLQTKTNQCSDMCNSDTNCTGIQFFNNTCRFLSGRCHLNQLKLGMPNAGQYNLREVPCQLQNSCRTDYSCFPPPGFSCACIDGFCYPHISNETIKLSGYHHYKGSCSVYDTNYYEYLVDSVKECSSKCNEESDCTGFTIGKRRCQLHRTVCSANRIKRQLATDNYGRDYFVKGNCGKWQIPLPYHKYRYDNFTCQTVSDCFNSTKSVCLSMSLSGGSWCECDRLDNLCVERTPDGGGLPLFIKMLNTTNLVIDLPSPDCNDRHVCCETLFSNRVCRGYPAAPVLCPKTCGTNSHECRNITKKEDPHCTAYKGYCNAHGFELLMKAACPVTCRSFHKVSTNCDRCDFMGDNCRDFAAHFHCELLAPECQHLCGC